jgi:hypothetical protein
MSEYAFPLQWPIGWPRAKQQRASAFKPHSIEQARVELIGELRMLRSQNPVLSSNLVLRKDGFPHSGQPQPRDPSAAVTSRSASDASCSHVIKSVRGRPRAWRRAGAGGPLNQH